MWLSVSTVGPGSRDIDLEKRNFRPFGHSTRKDTAMTAIISSVANIGTHPKTRPKSDLYNLIIQLLSRLKGPSEATRLKEEAIRMLSDNSANPDMCEWAERYLCGMVNSDYATFGEKRPHQS
jgi:hypothetical protein